MSFKKIYHGKKSYRPFLIQTLAKLVFSSNDKKNFKQRKIELCYNHFHPYLQDTFNLKKSISNERTIPLSLRWILEGIYQFLWLICWFKIFESLGCPIGSMGKDCSTGCPYPFFGSNCKNFCDCEENICHEVKGCLDRSKHFYVAVTPIKMV